MSILYADNFTFWSTLVQRGWSASSGGGVVAGTGQGGFDAMRCNSNSSNQHSVTRATFPVADRHATFIVHFYVTFLSAFTITQYCSLYGDAGATQHGTLLFNNDGTITVRRGGDTGTVIAGPSAAVITPIVGSQHHIQWKYTLSDTVGVTEVKVDGVTVLSATALDTKNAGTATVLDTVKFVGTSTINFSHLIVANGAGSVNNDFLGECLVLHAMPNADGDTVAFTPSTAGNHWSLVDEIPPNATDYTESSTGDGDIELYNHTDLSITGAIKAVIHANIAAKVGTDPKFLRDIAKVAGTEYQGASQVLSTSYVYYDKIYETNPATGVAWTAAQSNAAQLGIVGKDS